MIKKTRTLKKIVVEKVSLVDAAATRKKFFIIKGEVQMDKFIELLKALHGDEEITDELVKGMENMPDAQVKELEESLGVINEYRKAYPDEILEAIKMLSKHALNGRTGGKGKELTLEDAAEFVTDGLEKAGRKVSKEMKAKLIKIMNIIKEIVGDEDDDDKKKKSTKFTKHDELPEDIQEKLKKLEKLEKEKEDGELKKSKDAKEKFETEFEEMKQKLAILEAGTGIRKSFDPEDLTEDEKKELLKKKEDLRFPSLYGRFRQEE